MRSDSISKDEFIIMIMICNKIIDDADKYMRRVIKEITTKKCTDPEIIILKCSVAWILPITSVPAGINISRK